MWDLRVWQEYLCFFPETGLAKVLTGYLASDISPFGPQPISTAKPDHASCGHNDIGDDGDDDDNGSGKKSNIPLSQSVVTADERFIMMTEGIADASSSILAYRT